MIHKQQETNQFAEQKRPTMSRNVPTIDQRCLLR
jgi:hypothetical protein